MGLRLVHVAGVALSLVAGAAAADEAASCHPFDRSPPCCPHPPPQCCPAPLASLIDDALVHEICGADTTAKGESVSMDACRRYFARGDQTGEVSFSREPGDLALLARRKQQLLGPRAQVSDVTVAQAQKAFVIRDVDETGAAERSAAWALVGKELVHVEAERAACSDAQVVRLLGKAIERLSASTSKPRG